MAADRTLLSLLWLAGCLPLVTAPAATAALFDVARRRVPPPLAPAPDGVPADQTGTWQPFLVACRRHLRRGSLVGSAWAGVGLVLAIDLLIAGQMSGTAGSVLLVAVLALLLLYALASAALFPVLVSTDARAHQVLRTTVLVALMFPGRSLLGLAALAAAVVAVAAVPLAIAIVPGLVAVLLQRLYGGALHRLRQPLLTPPARAVAGLPSPTT